MATISEDYVSFETAKALKENGFDGGCTQLYNLKKQMESTTWPQTVKHDGVYMDKNGYILCPTLQMAMKWLRVFYNLFISIDIGVGAYTWTIHNTATKTMVYIGATRGTSEQACEAAIKYCLENLI